MGTRVAQGDGRFAGGDVARDDIDLVVVGAHPLDHVDHALAVSVGGVDDDHIDLAFGQRLDPLVIAGSDGRGHAQPVFGIAVIDRVHVADQ